MDLRVRVDNEQVAARALLAVLDYARLSVADFSFGPLSLEDLERDGLVVMNVPLDLSVTLDRISGTSVDPV